MTVEFETFYPALHAWLDVRAYPSKDGLSVYFHDVTKRKRAEEALRASEQRLRAIFNQAAVGMAVAALDGRFEQVNQRFSEILGYTPAELCERTFMTLKFCPHPRRRMRRPS